MAEVIGEAGEARPFAAGVDMPLLVRLDVPREDEGRAEDDVSAFSTPDTLPLLSLSGFPLAL